MVDGKSESNWATEPSDEWVQAVALWVLKMRHLKQVNEAKR
jgi:hypothetical protein